MTGVASSGVITSVIAESAVGTTPTTTPAFEKIPLDTMNVTASARYTERFGVGFGQRRTGVGRNGVTVTGTFSGGYVRNEYDTILESLFQGGWSSDALKDGTAQKTFTIQQEFPQGAGSGSNYFLRYAGCECTSGTLDITAGGDVTFSGNIIGTKSLSTAATAKISGATYVEPTSTVAFGSGADTVITMTGTGIGTLDCIQSFNVAFNYNGRDEQPKIGSNDLCGISRGGFAPVITGQFYVEDNFDEIYALANNGNKIAVTVQLGTAANQKTQFVFHSCEFVSAPLVTSDSGPAFQSFTMLPVYNATEMCIMTVKRNVA